MPEQDKDFLLKQQAALERMREMNRRANINGGTHSMPPSPAFVKVGQAAKSNDTPTSPQSEEKISKREDRGAIKGFIDNLLSGNGGDLGKPIFDKIGADPDMLLILGLVLILHSEKSDRMLLLALLYILM